MAQHTLSHFYPSYAAATEVMADLTALGIPETEISLIESENDARLPANVHADMAQSPARSGATLGSGIGLGLGALVGVGAIAVPLLDPLVAVGWFLPTIIGGVIGGLLGALAGMATRMGVTDKQSHSFAEGLQRGEHLLLVRVDDSVAAEVETVLSRDRRAGLVAGPALEEPAPYEEVTRVERIVDTSGMAHVRYVRERPGAVISKAETEGAAGRE